MAFRQPQRLQPVRQVSFPIPADSSDVQSIASPQRKRSLGDSQEEWVLFSPTAASTTQTDTTSTDRTPRTAALSRFSDFGPLDTAAVRSDQVSDEISENFTEHASDQDEDAELDSLDDGLHAFHEPTDRGSPRARLIRSNETVLPTHDGLGAFGESSAIQDHLRQFEQYGPRRKHRRTSSVQRTLDALEEVEELDDDVERIRRIEQWRLEQSRALLEEIEKETRRMRRMSRASAARSRAESINAQTKSETNFSSGIATPVDTEPVTAATREEEPLENESFWTRFTRRVIRNLIGIDEALLSVILGETLPEDTQQSSSTSSLPESKKELDLTGMDDPQWGSLSWQQRLLERLARELGTLVNQLSEHPGAFSTYMRTQEPPPYAALPNTSSVLEALSSDLGTSQLIPSASALFPPTLQPQVAPHSDPSLWGIEEESDPTTIRLTTPASDASRLEHEREYWEKELDVRMVFNFLKSRFSSSNPPLPVNTDTPFGPLGHSPLSPHPADSRLSSALTAHRAAVIRQTHPLASTSPNSSRRKDAALRALHHPQHHAGIARRAVRTASSSCASQSTKRSKRTGSSRNYWDVGGSVGSGPAGLGVWGEAGI
jgi:hypothetical protein